MFHKNEDTLLQVAIQEMNIGIILLFVLLPIVPLMSFTGKKKNVSKIQSRINPTQDPHCIYLPCLLNLLQAMTLPQSFIVSLDLDIFEEYKPVTL